MKKFFLVVLILFLAFAVLFVTFHEKAAGTFLEPILENKLIEIFGVVVEIDQLRANVFTGMVHADRIEFHNPPDFITETHFLAMGFEGKINLRALQPRV